MRRGTLNLLSSVIFMVIAVVAFYFMWNNIKGQYSDQSAATYNTVSISSAKTQARDLIKSLENNGNLPLGVPTSKMGKTNPFSEIEN